MSPKNILNAPTKLMKTIGYGRDYDYDHDAPDAFSGDDYWPEEMEPQGFYTPSPRGFEVKIAERLAYWDRLRKERRAGAGPVSSLSVIPRPEERRGGKACFSPFRIRGTL